MLDPDELINLAMESLIDVEGLTTIRNIEKAPFIADFPGINPLRRSKIPLFIAIHLQNCNKCKIIIPMEYSRESLIKMIEIEKEFPFEFGELPDQFFELAYILKISENAIEPDLNDTQESSSISSLIEKLKHIRLNKIWDGLKEMDGKAIFIGNLTRWEFNQVKVYFTGSMKEAKILQNKQIK
ncbi:hypothetical protein NUSPORA_01025 [Nucleospora cyclopteri]